MNATHRIFDRTKPAKLPELLSTPIEPEILASIAAQRRHSSDYLQSCLQTRSEAQRLIATFGS